MQKNIDKKKKHTTETEPKLEAQYSKTTLFGTHCQRPTYGGQQIAYELIVQLDRDGKLNSFYDLDLICVTRKRELSI